MSNENKSFAYSYSAKQQAEIKNIREKYIPREEDKMEQLRRLDAGVTQKGTVITLIVGVLSALVLGTGMCCCLVWEMYLPGVLIGVMGIIGVSVTYPLYVYIVKKEREKVAPAILRLADELMQ